MKYIASFRISEGLRIQKRPKVPSELEMLDNSSKNAGNAGAWAGCCQFSVCNYSRWLILRICCSQGVQYLGCKGQGAVTGPKLSTDRYESSFFFSYSLHPQSFRQIIMSPISFLLLFKATEPSAYNAGSYLVSITLYGHIALSLLLSVRYIDTNKIEI